MNNETVKCAQPKLQVPRRQPEGQRRENLKFKRVKAAVGAKTPGQLTPLLGGLLIKA